jgi:hypothetical protein
MKNSKTTPIVTVILFLAATVHFTPAVSADTKSEKDERNAPTISIQVEPTERPSFFINGMTLGAMMVEDDDNRMTSRDSSALMGAGLAFRGGWRVDDRHFIGGLFQGYWRSTRTVLDEQGGDNQWGAVSTYYLGPEYRFLTQAGIYFGASAGVAAGLALNDFEKKDGPDCNSVDCVDDHMQETDNRWSLGYGFRGTVGYEYRLRSNLGLNIEAFGGLNQGRDENDDTMTSPTFGLAIGVSN